LLDYNVLLVGDLQVKKHLEVEMQKNYHFSIARLKERVLYVVVENIDLITADGRETET